MSLLELALVGEPSIQHYDFFRYVIAEANSRIDHRLVMNSFFESQSQHLR